MQKKIPLLIVLQFIFLSLLSQDINPRINSGDLINQGIKLYDEGKYKEAIELYKKISHSDTNYNRVLYELALTYTADSNYHDAIITCEAGLKQPERDYELDLLVAYGSVIDYTGDSLRALKIYDSALLKYPNSQGLLLNKAITLIRFNKTKEAQSICEKLLLINPFYASAHFRFAQCAIQQGQVIPAMMSLFTYLIISPDGRFQRNAILQLSNISKATDDIVKSVEDHKEESPEYFSLIEQIILSKVALDKKYKLMADLDDPITRQLQVMMEKLEYKEEEDNFSMQFYVPFFKMIFEKKQFENSVNHAFSNLSIESIQKYLKKNKNEINDFKDLATNYLQKIKTTRLLNYTKREQAEEIYHIDNGIVTSKGNYDEKNKKLLGYWEFYHNNGNLKAAGNYNSEGKKTGEWKYYFAAGGLSGIDNWKDGIQDGADITYNSWGVIINKATYKNGELDGEKINYFAIGTPLNIINYQNGKRNGLSIDFRSTGRKRSEATYSDDKLNGLYKSYHENGQPEIIANYSNGELDKDYKSYYDNGRLSFECKYDHDKINGEAKNYYSNGQLQEKRVFVDNLLQGEVTDYSEDGKITSKLFYDKGKANGVAEYYDDGRLFATMEYKNDVMISAKYFDKKGKEIGSSQRKNKQFELTTYSPEGFKTSVSTYNDKGQHINGSTLFYSSGKTKEASSFVDGEYDGLTTGYNINGQRSAEILYSIGKKTGPYKLYYSNGQLKTYGWYDEDSQIDTWLELNEKGFVTERSYYLNGDQHGYKEFYFENGRINDEEIYRAGWLIGLNQYDTTGKLIYTTSFEKGNGHFKEIFPDGKTKSEGEYVDGEWHGLFKNYYCNGHIYTMKYFDHGLADSTYKEYGTNGKVTTEGQYKKGRTEGVWKYYTNDGILYLQESYADGELSKKLFYYPNGKTEREVEYKHDERNGSYKRYSDDGKLTSIVYYKDDAPYGFTYEDKNGQLLPMISLPGGNGKILTYYSNGTKSSEFEVADGKTNGSYRVFHPNGKLAYETNDQYGETNGRLAEYYSNGNLRTEYNYYLDNPDGPYKLYYENGKVQEEGNYFNGVLNGYRKFYDTTGKITETQFYYYGTLLNIK